MDKRTDFEFGQNSKAHRLALLLRAIEDVEREYAFEKEKMKNEYSERLSHLRQDSYLLRNEILTGQLSMTDIMNHVAAEVNAGALNKEGVTVTAEVKKAKQ